MTQRELPRWAVGWVLFGGLQVVRFLVWLWNAVPLWVGIVLAPLAYLIGSLIGGAVRL